MFDSSRWFQQSGHAPSASDADRKPFLRRHFWPPSAFGIIVISIVVSMCVGLGGAMIYTSSENAQLAAIDPTDQTRTAPTVPLTSEPTGPSTTKAPVALTQDGITKKATPSVWSVSSLDESGRPIEGSGFIAGSFGGQTYLLTSYAVVRAATRIPGPDIVVRNGGTEVKATLWTWHEERDLALLVTGRTAPSLSWADENPAAKIGDKVYVVAGGAAVAGVVAGVSAAGIQHNVFIDERRQGAPLLNDKGQIVGIVSLILNANAPSPDAHFAIPVSAVCERVLACGGGNASVPATVPPSGLNATTTTTSRG